MNLTKYFDYYSSIKKKLKKHYNYPSERESKLIQEGYDLMIKMAQDKASSRNSDEYKTQKKKDGTCPLCGDTTIVNKISRVQGSGSVSGSFMYGSGSIDGSSSIDTNEVNHCNKCGNQWKKYERIDTWSEEVIVRWLNDINTVYEGEYNFADKIIDTLKDIPAESIYNVLDNYASKCYSDTIAHLSLSYLRTKFKSVYDQVN